MADMMNECLHSQTQAAVTEDDVTKSIQHTGMTYGPSQSGLLVRAYFEIKINLKTISALLL